MINRDRELPETSPTDRPDQLEVLREKVANMNRRAEEALARYFHVPRRYPTFVAEVRANPKDLEVRDD